jgi:hypothetical protein
MKIFYFFVGVISMSVAALAVACSKSDETPTPQGETKSVLGKWSFAIVTTSGNGANVLTFSGDEAAGTFIDQYQHGGPWKRVVDSVFWEYKTGTTLPAGLVNKISAKITSAKAMTGTSAGVYNGVTFTGTWNGVKQE